jgi:hypothetical protein
VSHEANDSKDNEPSEETRQTVSKANDDGISENGKMMQKYRTCPWVNGKYLHFKPFCSN